MTRPGRAAPAVTPLPGSQAALWRAAADRLDQLDREAPDGPWRVTEGADAVWLANPDDTLTVALVPLPAAPTVPLIVTLRSLAPLWARHLRAQAAVAEIRERTPRIVHRDDTLTAIANTILGRTTP